jgi:hypothetical protein
MKKVLAIFLAAAVSAAMSAVGFAELTIVSSESDLIAAVQVDGNRITLGSDIEVSSPLMVTGSNVTIDGGSQYSISAADNFQWAGKDGCIITVKGSATLQDLTVAGSESANEKYGVQVYGSGAVMELRGVTIRDCGWGAMMVNGGSARADGLVLKNNGWGIEVDNGVGVTSTPSLTLSDVDISEQGSAAIWIPQRTSDLAHVDISGASSIVARVAVDNVGTLYYDLDGALTQGSGGTVVLEKNVTIDAPINISQALTLDGGGHKITAGFTTGDNAIIVTQPVTLKNLTVAGNSRMRNGIQNSNTTLNLEGVTVENCGHGGILTDGEFAATNVTGTLTLSGNGYGMEVANGASLDLSGCTGLNTESQEGNIVWVNKDTSTGSENINVGDTGLKQEEDENGNIYYPSEPATDPSDLPSLVISGLPATAVVGDAIEFSVTTSGSYNGNVKGVFTVGGTAPVTLEYWENAGTAANSWQPLTGSFGPESGFPYSDGATSRFRMTFTGTGSVTYVIAIAPAEGGSSVCATNGEIIVTEEGEAPAPVVTDNEPVISVTDNEANSTETQDAIRAGEKVKVKIYNSANAIFLKTMNLLGGNSEASLTVFIGDMSVTIPGGFGTVTEAGRIYYPMTYRKSFREASVMKALAGDVKCEAVEAGGSMVMPTSVTVTLNTRLEGTVYVYLYDENSGKLTYVASSAEKDGKITFTTTRLGHFLLTGEKL